MQQPQKLAAAFMPPRPNSWHSRGAAHLGNARHGVVSWSDKKRTHACGCCKQSPWLLGLGLYTSTRVDAPGTVFLLLNCLVCQTHAETALLSRCEAACGTAPGALQTPQRAPWPAPRWATHPPSLHLRSNPCRQPIRANMLKVASMGAWIQPRWRAHCVWQFAANTPSGA